MSAAIGYLRVSTSEQGRSGLGLDAQRHAIIAFAAKEGLSVEVWHQDIQTGAGADALLLRPGLASALKDARKLRCPLIVSRLDRLSRNVHFISGLMEHKVHFIVAALGRDCDNFTLHIYASLAEQERRMISDRIKVAIAAAKLRGRNWGMQGRSKAWLRRFRKAGMDGKEKAVQERTEAFRVHIEWALKQTSSRGGVISFNEAAKKLNERGIETSMGKSWDGWQIQRMARRLNLEHPLRIVKADALRAGVQALLEENPLYTVEEIRKDRRWPRALDVARVYPVVREFRDKMVRRNSAYRKIGWPVDHWTAVRIRIAKILQRSPNLIGWQVLDALGPECEIRLGWVQQVMKEYRSSSCAKSRRKNRDTYLKTRVRSKTSKRRARQPIRSS